LPAVAALLMAVTLETSCVAGFHERFLEMFKYNEINSWRTLL
jgi:hypothetical protein